MYDDLDPAELAVWIDLIHRQPAGFGLPAYELRAPRVALKRRAAMFATWYRDAMNPDHPSPQLCRRCGVSITRADQEDGRQVHLRCRFPLPDGYPPPRLWRWA